MYIGHPALQDIASAVKKKYRSTTTAYLPSVSLHFFFYIYII